MATTIRPEVSEKNRYWISKHRYYELRHFCLQYSEWQRERASIDSVIRSGIKPVVSSKTELVYDPTYRYAAASTYLLERMEMVEKAAIDSCGDMSGYVLKAVTEGLSYEHLKVQTNVPCGKDLYYILYRRFFWFLDKARK